MTSVPGEDNNEKGQTHPLRLKWRIFMEFQYRFLRNSFGYFITIFCLSVSYSKHTAILSVSILLRLLPPVGGEATHVIEMSEWVREWVIVATNRMSNLTDFEQISLIIYFGGSSWSTFALAITGRSIHIRKKNVFETNYFVP